MAEPARPLIARDEDAPSLDPAAIDRAYRRERARRRARVEHASSQHRSNVRFWFVLLLLAFITAFVMLAAYRVVQNVFGV